MTVKIEDYYPRATFQKMKAFASEHKIPVEVHVGRPTLAASYAPRVIGGRALPPFPVGKRDCTTDWKIVVSQRGDLLQCAPA
mgnify:CR=1 FL=1